MTQTSKHLPASRLQPLDAVRGFIMIVMALDHANAFITHAHPPAEFWRGAFPVYGGALPFLTRFVTHLAAPGFFFLMGAGVVLFADSRRQLGWTERAIAQHFIVRGILLLALQFFVENPAWQLSAVLSGGGRVLPIYFGVLYGLGGALILTSLLWRAPGPLVAGLSLLTLILPEVVIRFARPLTEFWPVGLFLIPTFTEIATVFYPLLPWSGLAGLGMIFGRALLQNHERAYRVGFFIGLGLLSLFLLVRAIGGFGNIRPPVGPGWIDFLNVVKYPPSLVFVLFTLGVDLMLLFLFSRLERWLHALTTLGRSPLFFYVAHLYLYGLVGFFFFRAGTGIPRMIPVWLAGLVVLYFLCDWYGRFKNRQSPESLWRFA